MLIFFFLILHLTNAAVIKARKRFPKPRPFSGTCGNADKLYSKNLFDLKKYPIPFTNFKMMKNLSKNDVSGTGHFSIVRKSFLENGEPVAIKEYTIFSKKNLVKELKILKILENESNIVKVIGITGNKSIPTVVYSYHSSTEYFNLTINDFKWWLKTLLETIDHIHAKGILHRDLKLNNILTDFKEKKLALIDFGLAEFNRFSVLKNPKMGCLRIKSPEMAIGIPYFDCSSDIWAVGLSCLDLMIGLHNHWDTNTIESLIQMMMKYFGGKNWNDFASKYDKSLKIKNMEDGTIFEFAMPTNPNLVTNQTFDLVSNMLILDPHLRISAHDALKHHLFDDMKNNDD